MYPSSPGTYAMQVVILVCVLVIALVGVIQLGVSVTKKYRERHPSEVAYEIELITMGVAKTINAIVICDNMGIIRYWNQGAENMFGWTFAEVKGKDLSFLMTAEDFKKHKEGLALAQTTGRLKKYDRVFEQKALHRFGEVIDVAITLSECEIRGVTHYTAIIKNIRERKEREAQHLREIELLRVGEVIGCVGTWSWDIATNRVTCTDGFTILFETDDAITDFEYIMRRVYYKDQQRVRKVIDGAYAKKEDFEMQYRINRLSGEPLPVICRAKVYLRENGTLKKIVGVVQKIDKYNEPDC